MSAGGKRDLDFVLSVLTDRRARSVCYYLLADDVSEVNELFLAREVAAWETGTDPSQVPTARVTHTLETLQDDLLPRLHEAELVTYRPEKGTVRYGDPPEPYARIVRICRSIEQPGASR